MDTYNFLNFLKNPDTLHQLTFQEINNLIEQYPYCQNLHYLALRKAQLEQHKDFQKKLELAATFCPDRKRLFTQLQELSSPLWSTDTEPPDTNQILGNAQAESDSPINPDMEALLSEMDEAFTNEIQQDEEPKHTTPSLSNFDNTEDMKLPDDKDKKVIYMEDLIDNMPPPTEEEKIFLAHQEPLEDEPPIDIPQKTEIPIIEEVHDNDEDIDLSESSQAASDEDEIQIPADDIPFEIVDTRHSTLPNEIEKTDHAEEEESQEWREPNPPTHTIHPPDETLDIIQQEEAEEVEDSPPPSESLEPAAPLTMKDENEDLNLNEDHSLEEITEITQENLTNETETSKPPNDAEISLAPLPKSSFKTWRKVADSASSAVPDEKPSGKKKKNKKKNKKIKLVELSDLFKKGKKKKKKKKKKKGFAMESLLEHEDIISETLAKIVAKQGSHKKAIKMYQKLININPDRKDYYQSRIEDLKNKR